MFSVLASLLYLSMTQIGLDVLILIDLYLVIAFFLVILLFHGALRSKQWFPFLLLRLNIEP